MPNSLLSLRYPESEIVLEALYQENPVKVRFLGDFEYLIQTPEAGEETESREKINQNWTADVLRKNHIPTVILSLGMLERFLVRVLDEKSFLNKRFESYSTILYELQSYIDETKDGQSKQKKHFLVKVIQDLAKVPKGLFEPRGKKKTLVTTTTKTPIFSMGNIYGKVRQDWADERHLKEFEQFQLETEDLKARELFRSDLDELWDEIEAGSSLNELLKKYLIGTYEFNLPFRKNPKIYKAIRPQPFFGQLLEVLADKVLKNIQQLIERRANPEEIELSTHLVLALAFHAGVSDSAKQTARTTILESLQKTLEESALQKGTKSTLEFFFKQLRKVGANHKIKNSTPDAEMSWERFLNSIDRIIKPSKLKVIEEETSEKNVTELPSNFDKQSVVLFLHTTATYEFRQTDEGIWQNRTRYEEMVTRQVNDGCTMSTLTTSGKKSNTPPQVTQPRKLWLFNLSIEPSVRETEETRYLDFRFPRECQAGEIFTTLYTSQLTYLKHSWDDYDRDPSLEYSIRDRLVTNPRQYKAFVYRSIFPAWYPLKIVTPKNGVLEDGIGSFFSRTVKQNEKEGFPKYYASPKQVEFVKSHTTFSVFRLPDKIIVELQVRGDETNDGFVPSGRYGIAYKRPTNQELTEALKRKDMGWQ
jgi:hypothetical protein